MHLLNLVTGKKKWPTTVEGAVSSQLSRMSLQDKAMVKATKQEDLVVYLHGWGKTIRSHYGLQGGNEQLLHSAGGDKRDAGTATMTIIEGIWKELQKAA
jgi:hypothetical protein